MTSSYSPSEKQTFLRHIALLSIALYIFLMIVFETLNSPLSSYASLGLYICLGCCGSYILIQRKIKLHWSIIVFCIFGILLSISALYTPTKVSIVNAYLRLYWTSFILLFIIGNIPATLKDVRFLIGVIVISGAVLSLYLYTFYGWEYLISSPERLDNAFGNQNNTAVRCAFSVIFAFYMLATQRTKLRFLWLIPAAICIPAIMFLASRKAILMIGAGLFTLFVVYSKNRNLIKKVVLIVLLLVALWYIIQYVPAFSVIKERFEETFNLLGGAATEDSKSDMNRIRYIEMSLAAFWESPLIGKGFYYSEHLLGTYSHNNFIELLLNNGIIGFAIYYFIYLKLFAEACKIKKTAPIAHAFVITTVITFVVLDIGVVSYFNRYTLILLIVCSTMLNIAQKENDSQVGKELT